MTAIVKLANGDIQGWLIAEDIPSMRRLCEVDIDQSVRDLAKDLYRMEHFPPGKYPLDDNFWLLVT